MQLYNCWFSELKNNPKKGISPCLFPKRDREPFTLRSRSAHLRCHLHAEATRPSTLAPCMPYERPTNYNNLEGPDCTIKLLPVACPRRAEGGVEGGVEGAQSGSGA